MVQKLINESNVFSTVRETNLLILFRLFFHYGCMIYSNVVSKKVKYGMEVCELVLFTHDPYIKT